MVTVSSGREFNFSFAFNDSDFSDRILRLEIIQGDDVPKVTTLHISSIVLAEKSPFFYKLFKNGMRESQNKNEVSLKINASEEATLMDLLRFMYGNCALDATSSDDLVDLLIVADKFVVTSCMVHCVKMLQNFPMSLESALAYFELPSSVLVSEIVKPLIDAAKLFVFSLYKDFNKSQDEAMQLHLSAIEVVLGSKGLKVVSEDDVLDFVLRRARASYPEMEQRRKILTKRLAPLICFTNMSVPKLKEVLDCADFDNEQLSKIVVEALFSKVDRSGVHLTRNSMDLSTTPCSSSGRVYTPHCVVFFDIKKGECADLYPLGRLESHEFRLGEKLFYISAGCGPLNDRFGIFLKLKEGSESCTLDIELSVMRKSTLKFESKYKVNDRTVDVSAWGVFNPLGITWTEITELMSDDSDYFIDDILRIKAELTLKNS